VTLSPDKKNAFFTDGLHDEIISTLANRAQGLEVISRTTMMLYRTAPKSVQEIARELGVTHVLEGSVQREGNTVRLTLQLINARTDEHVWSQDYDRTLKSALTLQSDVANEVASQLAVKLTSGTEPFRPLTQDPQANDLYLKAQLDQDASVRGLDTPLEDLRRIQGLLDGALARDPQFAAAYARRAGIRGLRFVYNYDTDGSALRLGRQDLDTAERLAPNDPDVLWIKAFYLAQIDRDLNGALAMYDAAEAAGLADAGWLSVKAEPLGMAGRLDEAIQCAERARTLDPKNQTTAGELVRALWFARRPAEAIRALDFALNEVPGAGFLRPFRAEIVWGYTGSASALRELANVRFPGEITATSDIWTATAQLSYLRLQHRYQDMMDVLSRVHTKVIRAYFAEGEYPLAELRGWVHLLLGDRIGAAQDGHELLDFLAHSKETKWNSAFVHLLGAEAAMFIGERPRAVMQARSAIELAQWPGDKGRLTSVSAALYAWAGAEDESTAVLERLSTELPMTLSPAAIARDPLYTVPLAGNARYQALRAKLEAQMAATKLE
jgi:TolB-like protein